MRVSGYLVWAWPKCALSLLAELLKGACLGEREREQGACLGERERERVRERAAAVRCQRLRARVHEGPRAGHGFPEHEDGLQSVQFTEERGELHTTVRDLTGEGGELHTTVRDLTGEARDSLT